MSTKHILLTGLLLVTAVAASTAQPLFSFETGTQGWTAGTTASLTTSTVGATDGTKSMAVTQTNGGWQWDAVYNNSGSDAFFNAFKAASLNPVQYRLEFDVTFRAADIPAGATWLQINVALNSSGGWSQLGDVAPNNGREDKLVHFSKLFSEFPTPLGVGSGWYQMQIGMNNGWASGATGTVYFDNFRVTAVPEPSTVALLAAGALALAVAVRRRSSRR